METYEQHCYSCYEQFVSQKLEELSWTSDINPYWGYCPDCSSKYSFRTFFIISQLCKKTSYIPDLRITKINCHQKDNKWLLVRRMGMGLSDDDVDEDVLQLGKDIFETLEQARAEVVHLLKAMRKTINLQIEEQIKQIAYDGEMEVK